MAALALALFAQFVVLFLTQPGAWTSHRKTAVIKGRHRVTRRSHRPAYTLTA